MPADGVDRDTLSLRTGDFLLGSLETKEWGRPLALGTVIVGIHILLRDCIPFQWLEPDQSNW